jgi:hypothetical protein
MGKGTADNGGTSASLLIIAQFVKKRTSNICNFPQGKEIIACNGRRGVDA